MVFAPRMSAGLAALFGVLCLVACDDAVAGDAGLAPTDARVPRPDAYVPPPIGSPVTTVTLSGSGTNLPVTFGQVFRPGDIPAGANLAARSGADGVPLQVDVKATHADGSLRHAILTVDVPRLEAGTPLELELLGSEEPTPSEPIAVTDVLDRGFDANVSVDVEGTTYAASARAGLMADAGSRWLSGPYATEWIVAVPLRDASGAAHPHLTVRFEIRAHTAVERVRVGVTVENDWTYEPAPQNFTYDLRVEVAGDEVMAETGLEHFRQSRWRRVFYWGPDPEVEVAHDYRYLVSTAALPNFDPTLEIPESRLVELAESWASGSRGPMQIGPMEPYMPATGAHRDIGPLHLWDALFLVSQDPRARVVALGVGELSGSWPIHYRDRNTDRPVSLDDYPYMTLLGNPGDANNPDTGRSELFPDCAAECGTPYTPDTAHQPSLAYLPYVVTGDYYFLEEVQFWTNWNLLRTNPGYRNREEGLLHPNQVRAQAWALRTLGYAAYITPDAHPLKSYYVEKLANNRDYYRQRYVVDEPNPLGVMDRFAYDDGAGMAPWQDDFFTWTVGQLVAMGFEGWRPMLDWKVRFVAGRMADPGYCWIFAAAYSLGVRPTADDPFYRDLSEVFRAQYPDYVDVECGGAAMASMLELSEGEMTGYSTSPTGYPSNMQPALAVAVESGLPLARAGWDRFVARPVQPDYTGYPNFAIVPR